MAAGTLGNVKSCHNQAQWLRVITFSTSSGVKLAFGAAKNAAQSRLQACRLLPLNSLRPLRHLRGGCRTQSADFDFQSVAWHGLALHVTGAGNYVDHANIPGTLLFQIGGDSSVRGYEPGAANGHAGYAIQSELHDAIPAIGKYIDLYVFFDTGQVWSSPGQHARADGAGVGMLISQFKHFSLQTSCAFARNHLAASPYAQRIDLKASLAF